MTLLVDARWLGSHREEVDRRRRALGPAVGTAEASGCSRPGISPVRCSSTSIVTSRRDFTGRAGPASAAEPRGVRTDAGACGGRRRRHGGRLRRRRRLVRGAAVVDARGDRPARVRSSTVALGAWRGPLETGPASPRRPSRSSPGRGRPIGSPTPTRCSPACARTRRRAGRARGRALPRGGRAVRSGGGPHPRRPERAVDREPRRAMARSASGRTPRAVRRDRRRGGIADDRALRERGDRRATTSSRCGWPGSATRASTRARGRTGCAIRSPGRHRRRSGRTPRPCARDDRRVVLGLGQVAERERRLLEGRALVVRLLRDLGGACRSRSCGVSAVTSISELPTSSSIRARSGSSPSTQNSRKVRQLSASSTAECSRFLIITGLKTFSSKLPCEPAILIAVSLPRTWHDDHRHRLGLRRVHLARHDRRAGLVLGQDELADPGARAGAEPADVVRDLHQRRGERRERAAHEHDASWAASAANLFGAVTNGRPVDVRDLRAHTRRRTPRARSGLSRPRCRRSRARTGPAAHVDPREVGVQLRDVSGELLAQGRAARRPAGGCGRSSRCRRTRWPSRPGRRGARALEGTSRCTITIAPAMCIAVGNVSLEDCDMFTWSLGCTGRLGAELAARHLDRPVRDDLVAVHVGLRARAGLPHVEREVVVQRAVDHLVRRGHDQVPDRGSSVPELHVGLSRRLLEDARSHARPRAACGRRPATRSRNDGSSARSGPPSTARRRPRSRRANPSRCGARSSWVPSGRDVPAIVASGERHRRAGRGRANAA